jgi:glutamyl-Q tRNA(Asp) synthetase
MTTAQPVFRFAPSPNGLMHLGHALSALTNFRAAQATGGRFLLRIEDIDPARAREEHILQLFDDLAWLGLSWEEPVRRQSAHFAEYQNTLDGLRARGLVYPCFCSRSDIARVHENSAGAGHRDPDGAPLYPGTCRKLDEVRVHQRIASGEKPAWRLDMTRALPLVMQREPSLSWREARTPEGGLIHEEPARPEAWGDVVLGRNEVPTSYQLSVVLDDAAQGISHVVRGLDLFHATGLQRLLQVLLGLPAPVYHHHRLILDETGRKLSKSRHSLSLKAMRDGGATRGDAMAMIGLEG